MSIEPGSLDLDSIHLRIGGVKTSNQEQLKKGHKFVIVEQFADLEGKAIDALKFDISTMCYSLFVSPELNNEFGRHKRVLRHHDIETRIGRIVGGGLLRVVPESKFFLLGGFSVDFDSEPLSVREKMCMLLSPILQETLGVHLDYDAKAQITALNVYWLRFRQIVDQIKEFYGSVHRKIFEQEIATYHKTEAMYDHRKTE